MNTDRPTKREDYLDKEVSEMAILAKPGNIPFELDSKKAGAFFAVSKKNLFKKAIARSEKHIKSANSSKEK